MRLAALRREGGDKPLRVLLQIGCGNKPLAEQSLALDIARSAITGKGIQEMPVILNLVAVGGRLRRQFAWERAITCW